MRSTMTAPTRIGFVLMMVTLLAASRARGASFADSKATYSSCYGFCSLQFGSEQSVDACCGFSITELVKCSATCFAVYLAAFDQCFRGCADVLLSGNIDVVGSLSEDARQVRVGGPLECTAGFKVPELTVTITQSGTPGVAVGKWKGPCTGSPQHWDAVAALRGEGAATLLPGPATACAISEFTIGGQGAEAKQWCQEVTLLPAGTELEP